MQPAPVGVERDLTRDGGGNAGSRVLLERERGVDLSELRANLLGTHSGEEREGEECCSGEHSEFESVRSCRGRGN